jgi:hypothetical protein
MQYLQPFGFRPSFHPSGNANPRTPQGLLTAANATIGLFQNQPVAIVNGTGWFGASIANNTPIDGIFFGLQYLDANGRVLERNQIAAGTPFFNSNSGNNGDAYNNYVMPYMYSDPMMEFNVQITKNNATPINGSNINDTFNIDWTGGGVNGANGVPGTAAAPNGNAAGISTTGLDCSTIVAAGAGQFILVGLAKLPNNTWSDAYPIVRVKLNNILGA